MFESILDKEYDPQLEGKYEAIVDGIEDYIAEKFEKALDEIETARELKVEKQDDCVFISADDAQIVTINSIREGLVCKSMKGKIYPIKRAINHTDIVGIGLSPKFNDGMALWTCGKQPAVEHPIYDDDYDNKYYPLVDGLPEEDDFVEVAVEAFDKMWGKYLTPFYITMTISNNHSLVDWLENSELNIIDYWRI